MTGATDYNGHAHIFTYDAFGRLAKTVKPGDSMAYPTEQYSYEVGNKRSYVKTDKRATPGSDELLTSITFYDGLGRKLQTRSSAGDGKAVVTAAVDFNAHQTIRDTYLPYFDTGFDYREPDAALPKTTKIYDPIGRAIRTINPDGTFTSIAHKPLVQELYDEEDNRAGSLYEGTPTILTQDGLSRQVSTEEVNVVEGQIERYLTQIEYDLLGNITKMTDAQNNIKTMKYDALSRRIEMNDPNRGTTVYKHDDNGNIVYSLDAKGQEVHYNYDSANRLVTERWSFNNGQADVINATYHYDTDVSPLYPDAQNTMGQIAYVEDQVGTIHFSYEPRGNMIGSIRRYEESGLAFVTRKSYDSMERLTEAVFPDGSAVQYEYDGRGLLQRIPGFVNDVRYDAAGQRTSIAYFNGVETTYKYDLRQRLEHLQTQNNQGAVQDLRYTLDGAGNVMTIADGRTNRTPQNDQSQSYAYDGLYRMVQAAGAYGQIDFGYDSVGNMVRKNSTTNDPRLNLGEIKYGENGAGPYALTSAAGLSYSYDANGNLAKKDNTTYSWNPRDLLVGVDDGTTRSSYVYDSSSQRSMQIVRTSEQIKTILYPHGSAEMRDGELVFYVFDDEARVADVIVPFDQSRLLKGFSDAAPGIAPASIERRWYVADHLDGTGLLLGDEGNVVSERIYHPYGLTRTEENGEAMAYGYTGKELDASGLHYYEARYYDSLIGRFISPDPQYLEKPKSGLQNPQLLNLYAYTLNNPLKYNDPDGASPKQGFVLPISQADNSHPRAALAFEMNVTDYSAYGAPDFEKGMKRIEGRIRLLTKRGDKWVPTGGIISINLKFTALPNGKTYSLPGTQYKQVWEPQTVKNSGSCIGNMCLVTSRASGGKYRHMETQAMMGHFEIMHKDGTTTPLSEFTKSNSALPFKFKHATGKSNMEPQYGVAAGVGFTSTGANPEQSTDIAVGPTFAGSLKMGSRAVKAQHPKN